LVYLNGQSDWLSITPRIVPDCEWTAITEGTPISGERRMINRSRCNVADARVSYCGSLRRLQWRFGSTMDRNFSPQTIHPANGDRSLTPILTGPPNVVLALINQGNRLAGWGHVSREK